MLRRTPAFLPGSTQTPTVMYLNTHSFFSLRYGTLSPLQLAAAASAIGLKELVLTDINNTSGSYAFIRACQEKNIKPILGIEFRRDHRFLYLGIARNEEGFRELNHFLSTHSLDHIPLPDIAPKFENCIVIYDRLIKPLSRFYAHEYLGVRPEFVHRLFDSPVKKALHKLVALRTLTFVNEDGNKVHKLLRAIDLNILISKLKPAGHAPSTARLDSLEKLMVPYATYTSLLTNTKKILAACSIKLTVGPSNNRKTFTGDRTDDLVLLRKLAINGCLRRYGAEDKAAVARVEKELALIDQMNFAPYFLITWDIIRYAKTTNYHHVGRGSGANSIVAYCLGITDVNPIELDLYFERFINPYRSSPPDFDIDFSWDQRDDVTDYIFKRYGRDYTALLATYSTFKGKSILRELGKVFGLPKEDIDQMIRNPDEVARQHRLVPTIRRYAALIEGFPNHLSIHAGGILITERPIHYHTALQMMPKGFPVTHFDMYGAEDLGFHKYDVLSQRGIGHIKDAVKLIKKNRGHGVDIHAVEEIKKDSRVKKQLASGNCIGCFYIESPAMRGLLTKLNCANYVHLVAASSIIRPGVAKSGMMREYIRRFHEPHSFDYLHETFKTHLGETFGIMVYQEDVMKICHHFAGLELDESDVLRRMMTGKKRTSAEFNRLRNKFFSNCKERKHPDELAAEVWRQIESFSGYSFCKAHSASYAVESFQSLYLKAYYPLEFMVAVINNFGGFYRTEFYFHEARMQGGNIHGPCVNHSFYLTDIRDKDIYMGFIHLHQLTQRLAIAIVIEREKQGNFKNMTDFVNRIDVAPDQLEILIRIGAFRFTGMNKYELMWEKNRVHNPRLRHRTDPALFVTAQEAFKLPELEIDPRAELHDQLELIGFSLETPFATIAPEEITTNQILARNLKKYTGKMIEIIGYLVTKKPVRTSNKKLMNFGTWLDREGHYFDTIHFPPALKRFPLQNNGCYKIRGRVVLDYDFPSVEVVSCVRV